MSTSPMNMCSVRRPPSQRIVTPSAISSAVSTAAVAQVRSSLPAVPADARTRDVTQPPVPTPGEGRVWGRTRRCGGRGGGACGAARRGGGGGGRRVGGDRLGVEDRVAPVVELDPLGEQLGARAVTRAGD